MVSKKITERTILLEIKDCLENGINKYVQDFNDCNGTDLCEIPKDKIYIRADRQDINSNIFILVGMLGHEIINDNGQSYIEVTFYITLYHYSNGISAIGFDPVLDKMFYYNRILLNFAKCELSKKRWAGNGSDGLKLQFLNPEDYQTNNNSGLMSICGITLKTNIGC